jgi:hypothetical protein
MLSLLVNKCIYCTLVDSNLKHKVKQSSPLCFSRSGNTCKAKDPFIRQGKFQTVCEMPGASEEKSFLSKFVSEGRL